MSAVFAPTCVASARMCRPLNRMCAVFDPNVCRLGPDEPAGRFERQPSDQNRMHNGPKPVSGFDLGHISAWGALMWSGSAGRLGFAPLCTAFSSESEHRARSPGHAFRRAVLPCHPSPAPFHQADRQPTLQRSRRAKSASRVAEPSRTGLNALALPSAVRYPPTRSSRARGPSSPSWSSYEAVLVDAPPVAGGVAGVRGARFTVFGRAAGVGFAAGALAGGLGTVSFPADAMTCWSAASV